MKLMVSVGKGERCMRLWNLVTGKRAGVLNFGREILESIKESRYSHGEGRRIGWSPTGNEFAVTFERGVVVFGEDSRPKSRLLPQPLTKVHQTFYLRFGTSTEDTNHVIAASTEDGRILFYSSSPSNGRQDDKENSTETSIPNAKLIAQLNSNNAGVSGRIKDFAVIDLPSSEAQDSTSFIVTASSDGSIRIWQFTSNSLVDIISEGKPRDVVAEIGKLVGTYETGSRITCLKAFLMRPPGPEDGLSEFEGLTEDGEETPSSNSSVDDDE
jgi:protein MAK11